MRLMFTIFVSLFSFASHAMAADVEPSTTKGCDYHLNGAIGVGDADKLEQVFNERGVSARRPVPTPIHRLLGLPDPQYPRTAMAADHALSLPLYPDLSDDESERVISVAREILS